MRFQWSLLLCLLAASHAARAKADGGWEDSRDLAAADSVDEEAVQDVDVHHEHSERELDVEVKAVPPEFQAQQTEHEGATPHVQAAATHAVKAEGPCKIECELVLAHVREGQAKVCKMERKALPSVIGVACTSGVVAGSQNTCMGICAALLAGQLHLVNDGIALMGKEYCARYERKAGVPATAIQACHKGFAAGAHATRTALLEDLVVDDVEKAVGEAGLAADETAALHNWKEEVHAHHRALEAQAARMGTL